MAVVGFISSTGLSLAEMVDERIRKFPCSGKINFTVRDAPAAIAAVQARFARFSPEVDRTHGFSADFGEWRLNLPSSDTEPLVRLNIESPANPALVEDRVDEVSGLMATFA